MSAGAHFRVIVNADTVLNASSLLRERIASMARARAWAGSEPAPPSLASLEESHVMFFQGHFKPFAAVGFQYAKIGPMSESY